MENAGNEEFRVLFEIPMAETTKGDVFWDRMPCILVEILRLIVRHCFRLTCCLIKLLLDPEEGYMFL
jgi:hypothetical protein